MQKFCYLAGAALCLSLALCTVLLTRHATRLLDSWATIPNRLEALQVSIDRLPAVALPLVTKPALSEIDRLGSAALGKVDAALSRYDSTLELLDRRASELLSQAAGLRTDARPLLENAAAAAGAVKPVLDGAAALLKPALTATQKAADIASHVDDALPPFTDCAYLDAAGNPLGGNPDCLFNRYQGASKAFERTMEAIAKAAPGVAASADSTAASISREADSLTKPPTFWQGVKSWLLILSRCLGLLFL